MYHLPLALVEEASSLADATPPPVVTSPTAEVVTKPSLQELASALVLGSSEVPG
jgi:hypothetical protein